MESSSSYWRSYSQQSQRHRRGWTSLFRSKEEPSWVAPGDTDSCVCVRFDRCSDGNFLHHGADLLDFRCDLIVILHFRCNLIEPLHFRQVQTELLDLKLFDISPLDLRSDQHGIWYTPI